MNICLASKSPRRKMILEMLFPKFSVIDQDFDESTVKFEGDCKKHVMELSVGKVNSIESIMKENLYISCDTIVYNDGNLLGKPKNNEDAYKMLSSLSNKWHEVHTGIAIKYNDKLIVDSVKTEVKFSTLESKDIIKYINNNNVLDKAGAYGIQDYGGTFVNEIRGCFYNVMGLPINKLKEILTNLKII